MKKVAAFSLLEVLISLVIFSVAAVVLGSAYLNILNSYAVVSRGSGDEQEVAFARQQLLTQAELVSAQNGEEFDSADGRHVKWTAQVDPTGTADLFSVNFTCIISSSAAGTEAKTVKQSFMLLRPTWSDPTDRAALRQNAASRIAKLQGKST